MLPSTDTYPFRPIREPGVYEVPVIFPEGRRLLIAVDGRGRYVQHRWCQTAEMPEVIRDLHRLVVPS